MNKQKTRRKKTVDVKSAIVRAFDANPAVVQAFEAKLAIVRTFKILERTGLTDFLHSVIWYGYETEKEAIAVAEKKLRSRLTPEQWEALLEVLKVLVPILIGMIAG